MVKSLMSYQVICREVYDRLRLCYSCFSGKPVRSLWRCIGLHWGGGLLEFGFLGPTIWFTNRFEPQFASKLRHFAHQMTFVWQIPVGLWLVSLSILPREKEKSTMWLNLHCEVAVACFYFRFCSKNEILLYPQGVNASFWAVSTIELSQI